MSRKISVGGPIFGGRGKLFSCEFYSKALLHFLRNFLIPYVQNSPIILPHPNFPLDIFPNLPYAYFMDNLDLLPTDPDRTPKDESGYAIGRPQVDKVRYSHDAMIDVIITNPRISQTEIARHFGYTQAWVCTIFNSESFQKRLQDRREELIDPAILTSIEERFKALASRSLDRLMEHLDRPIETIDPEIMIKAAALGAKSIGLGLPKVVQQTTSTEEQLQDLGWKLTRLLHKSKEESSVIDVAPPPEEA